MVLSATMAEYASDQSATSSAAAAEVQIAKCGLRKRGVTDESCGEKGKPPSRAKAKSMRELEVTLESPQNHIAAMAMSTSALPVCGSACCRTKMNGLSAAAAAGRSPMERVTATSSAYPATPLTATLITIPQAALREGSCVSSLRCALASYPVKVQHACRSPMANGPPCLCQRKAGGWCGAKSASAPAMTATPTMWTQAERSLSRATRRTPR